MKYKIVHGSLVDIDWFNGEIETLIGKGWFLVGGVSTTWSEWHKTTLITQALAKATEPEAIDPWSAG